jgi:hypothetical protein
MTAHLKLGLCFVKGISNNPFLATARFIDTAKAAPNHLGFLHVAIFR